MTVLYNTIGASAMILAEAFANTLKSAGNLSAASVLKNIVILIVMGSVIGVTTTGLIFLSRQDFKERVIERVPKSQELELLQLKEVLANAIPIEFTEKPWYVNFYSLPQLINIVK